MNECVITGVGIVSAIGVGKEKFWESVVNNRSGIQDSTFLDLSKYNCKKVAEVKEIVDKSDRGYKFLKTAVEEAISDAKLFPSDISKQKVKVIIGSAHGSLIDWENWYRKETEKFFAIEELGFRLNKEFNINSLPLCVSTACTSSAIALGLGLNMIREELADVVIVAGVDVLTEFVFAGFHSLRALSSTFCRPFDKTRDGLVLGEGAAAVVLENYDHAKKRNVEIYCKLQGFATTSDAKNFTAPDFGADGIYRCVVNALSDAKVEPKDVSYINAHGTGTLYNDKAECVAYKKVFQQYMSSIPISSIKSMVGHTSGACGVIEAVLCCLCIKHSFVPATFGLQTPEEEFSYFNFVSVYGREQEVKFVVSTNLAFGGSNACVVFGKK